jgi:hypothetical protein
LLVGLNNTLSCINFRVLIVSIEGEAMVGVAWAKYESGDTTETIDRELFILVVALKDRSNCSNSMLILIVTI